MVPEDLHLRWRSDRHLSNMSVVGRQAFEHAKGILLRDLGQQLGWIYVDCEHASTYFGSGNPRLQEI